MSSRHIQVNRGARRFERGHRQFGVIVDDPLIMKRRCQARAQSTHDDAMPGNTVASPRHLWARRRGAIVDSSRQARRLPCWSSPGEAVKSSGSALTSS